MARIKKTRLGETPEAARALRVAIYTRVSSEMQLDGYSLESQLDICREYTAKKGWQEAAVYTDEGESARKADRPQFQAMVRDGKQRKFDVVIVMKLDRFARCRRDTENYLYDLNEAGLEIISAKESQFDFTTAAGKAYLGMISTFNQYYSDALAENVAVGKATRTKSHGLWNGQVPFGYQVTYLKDGGDGVPYPDSHETKGVRLAFEQYATGMYSDTDIAQMLNEAGYRPRGRGARALPLFSKDTIRETLQSRFYLGEARYRDQWFPARQDSIIAEELFARCEEVRRRRGQHKAGTTARQGSRDYPLTGIACCARCGGRLRGAFVGGKSYYRDIAREQGRTCDQRMVRADVAEAALGRFLGRLVLPADWRAQILVLVKARVKAVGDVEAEQARINALLERLKRLFLLGDLAEREYVAERDRLRNQLAALLPPAMPYLERAAALLRDFSKLWDAATPPERRQILQTLLAAVYLDVEHGPVVAVEPRAQFAALFAMMRPGGKSAVGPAGDIMILNPGEGLAAGEVLVEAQGAAVRQAQAAG